MTVLEETVLEADEIEALRLADLEGCYHNDAAERMGVSRQTFGNIVKRARQKIADALINGKAIRLSSVQSPELVCPNCGRRWAEIYSRSGGKACPDCDKKKNKKLEERG